MPTDPAGSVDLSDDRMCEAFDLIARYAERQGWIPIGRKDFRVGPWRIRVNGAPETWDGVPPFAALVEHDTIVAMMVLDPFGGTVSAAG